MTFIYTCLFVCLFNSMLSPLCLPVSMFPFIFLLAYLCVYLFVFLPCVLVRLFACGGWSMHPTSKRQAKWHRSVDFRSLAPQEVHPLLRLSFRTMSSCFPRLGFLSRTLLRVTPFGCGYIYISTLCDDILCMPCKFISVSCTSNDGRS